MAETIACYAPVERGDYGTVRIMVGQYAGRWGYYTSDESDEPDARAIVGVDGPGGDVFLHIPRAYLALTTEGADVIEAWIAAYPMLARNRGITVRRLAS